MSYQFSPFREGKEIDMTLYLIIIMKCAKPNVGLQNAPLVVGLIGLEGKRNRFWLNFVLCDFVKSV